MTMHAQEMPDKAGFFGEYGGQFVPPELKRVMDEINDAYDAVTATAVFQEELADLYADYVGRPSPLYYARRLTDKIGGARIFLKREDLNHTGAHKINHCLGEALLAKHMGKTKVLAETGAGQHGVALATASALLGLECIVYMGSVDMARQQPNVFRMKLLGATCVPVESGSKTLKDAINEAIRDWVTNVETTFYLLGSALGPHPYPMMVRDFQSVIGIEAREQIVQEAGRLPDVCIACVGGGSNAIGLFHAFREDEHVELIGVEAGGHGISGGEHAARFADPNIGRIGVLQGTKSFVMQNEDGQIVNTHSISAGLDYASVGPEHAYLRQSERAYYTYATDEEALAALQTLSKLEGIIPALESSHAVAEAIKRAPTMSKDSIVLINLSGRGDKDLDTVIKALG